MVVCLTILTIISTTCVENAQPIGQCVPRLSDVVDCVVDDPHTIPIRASWYNPELGGVNCDSDCSTTGDGTPIEYCFDKCLACPIGWYGSEIEFEDWIGTWQCRDHGGGIKPQYGRVYTPSGFEDSWHIIVDFMTYQQPEWAYLLLEWEAVE